MSARLVQVSDELAALADQCHEPARADEPYRRALRVIHAKLTATAAEILDRQPEHQLDLGLQRYHTPRELLAGHEAVREGAERLGPPGAPQPATVPTPCFAKGDGPRSSEHAVY